MVGGGGGIGLKMISPFAVRVLQTLYRIAALYRIAGTHIAGTFYRIPPLAAPAPIFPTTR